MKKVKIVKITKQEVEDLTQSHKEVVERSKKDPNKYKAPEKSLEEIIAANKNQTLVVLRQMKSAYKWDDIEAMVDYVGLIKRFDTDLDEVTVDSGEHDLLLEVFSSVVKDGKIQGAGVEKFVEIYSAIKDAQ
jgi:hypothetical protein